MSGNSSPQVNSPPRYDDEDDDNSFAPEGFDEIEKAFSRVAMFADDLLETIQDDSLRSERKRDKNKKKLQAATNKLTSKRAGTRSTIGGGGGANYVTDSDDDQINNVMDKERQRRKQLEEEDVVQTHTQSYYNRFDRHEADTGYYNHHRDTNNNNSKNNDHDDDHDLNDVSNNSYSQESDVSSLDMTFGGAFDGMDGDESIDGSLVHDVVNLKSKTKAMQAEMLKQEEAFRANVTEGCDGKPFFQKMEDAAAAQQRQHASNNARTPKIKNLNISSRPTTISVRKRGGVGSPPVLVSAGAQGGSSGQKQKLKLKVALFVEQLKRFCNHKLLGSSSSKRGGTGGGPNLPLIAINLVIWLFLFKILLVAKTDGLIDGDGYLR